MSSENYKSGRFITAELLACVTFILNTICVVTAKEKHGPFSPAWLPHFGVVYWTKTILAYIGVIYFFMSRPFFEKRVSRYVIVCTLVVFCYSIPVVNSLLTLPLDAIFSLESLSRNQGTTYESRIPTQIIWSIPMFMVAFDLLKRLIKNIMANKNV